MALRLRRGTDLERQSVIFAEGELVYTTDTKSLYVGDGQTLGGILISSNVNESPASLTKNLDLNSYDIIGGGDINISGVVTANQFVGDGSGLTNLNNLNVVDGGFYSINIIGADSSVIVNRDTNTFTGNLVGDVIGTLKGDVIGSDSSVIINSANNEIYGKFIGDVTAEEVSATTFNSSNIFVNTDTLSIFNNQNNQSVSVQISSTDERSLVKLIRESDSDISSDDLIYGSIFFGRNDSSGLATTGIILGKKDAIFLSVDPAGAFPESSYITLKNGNFGVGTYNPENTLDVRGNIKASNFIQFGSITTVERNTLTPVNGMVIYNTTDNRFQGYQNGTWINLDNGSVA